MKSLFFSMMGTLLFYRDNREISTVFIEHVSCVICDRSQSGTITIRKDCQICFSCAYVILYRFFGKNSKVGIQWLAHAWKKDDKTKQVILRIAEKINSLIS